MSSASVHWPEWLQELRRIEIVRPVRDDTRSQGDSLLGLSLGAARALIRYGQADFNESHGEYSSDDLALLYAYCNQKLHLEELVAAFSQIFGLEKPDDPIVLDIGCGPFTGGLALSATLGDVPRFDYIGIDRSKSMRSLGERLAASDLVPSVVKRHWYSDTSTVVWTQPPSWRDVIVVISYLFASPTLDTDRLHTDLVQLIKRLGQGLVTLLYINSISDDANAKFQLFREKLEDADFETQVSERIGKIQRLNAAGPHTLKYSLLRLAPRYTLEV